MSSAPPTVRAYFEEHLPKRLAQHPHIASALHSKVGFHITTDGGGDWTVDANPPSPSVRAGVDDSSVCVLTLTTEDFLAVAGKTMTLKRALSEGRLKVKGDMGVALKLDPLF